MIVQILNKIHKVEIATEKFLAEKEIASVVEIIKPYHGTFESDSLFRPSGMSICKQSTKSFDRKILVGLVVADIFEEFFHAVV
jgi:hypothetical protein